MKPGPGPMEERALVPAEQARMPRDELLRRVRAHFNARLYFALLGCGSVATARFSPRQRDKLACLLLWAGEAAHLGNAFVMDKLLRMGGFSLRVDPDRVRACPAKELAWQAFVGGQGYQEAWLSWHVGAAVHIQRRWRQWSRRRHAAARRIQRACRAWILKPVTADGKLGINVRLLLAMGGRPA